MSRGVGRGRHARLGRRSSGPGASGWNDGAKAFTGVPQRGGVEGGCHRGNHTGDGCPDQSPRHAELGAERGGGHGGQGATNNLGNGQVQGPGLLRRRLRRRCGGLGRTGRLVLLVDAHDPHQVRFGRGDRRRDLVHPAQRQRRPDRYQLGRKVRKPTPGRQLRPDAERPRPRKRPGAYTGVLLVGDVLAGGSGGDRVVTIASSRAMTVLMAVTQLVSVAMAVSVMVRGLLQLGPRGRSDGVDEEEP